MGSVWLRRILLAVAVVLAVVFIVQAVRFAPVPEPPKSEDTAAVPAQEPLQITQSAQARWTVGVWQGSVAVFEGESTQPSRVLETPVTALPVCDRQALEAGIPVDDPEVLAGLLEDYGS